MELWVPARRFKLQDCCSKLRKCCRAGREEEGSRRGRREGEGGARLERRRQCTAGPTGSGSKFSLWSLRVSVIAGPGGFQRTRSWGTPTHTRCSPLVWGQTRLWPPRTRRLGEGSAFGARPHSVSAVPRAQLRTARVLGPVCAPGQGRLGDSAPQSGVLASSVPSDEVGGLGTRWAPGILKVGHRPSGSTELSVVFTLVPGCAPR